MVPVDEGAEREEREVLARCHRQRQFPLVAADPAPRLVEDEPEDRAVGDMDGEAQPPPVGAAREELAEERDVRVVVPDDPLVNRLLQRPDGGRDGSRRC